MPELLYKEESYEVRGACFSVYNSLGGGIREAIIESAYSGIEGERSCGCEAAKDRYYL